MKTGLDALGTTENDSGRANAENGSRHPRYRRIRLWERKTRKLELTPSVPPSTRPCAQNMKTGLIALGTIETSPGGQNMKTGPDALDTAENEYGSAKIENGTRRPRYLRKRVRERKT
jgi:hypothetical protein